MAYVNIHIQELSGATPTWNALYKFAKLTADAATAITIEGAEIPDAGVLFFRQGTGGPHTLTINGAELTVNATGLTRIDWAYDGEDYAFHTNVQGGTSGSGEVITPDAPTSGTVDDINNTFSYTLSTGYLLADHEQTLDGGETWGAASNPVSVGDVAKAVGQVGVRVKAATGRNASAALYNASAFTVADSGGLVAAWNFDEASTGNATDALGTYPLTSQGSTNRTTGKINNRADCNYSLGYFKNASLLNDTSTFSLNLWVIFGGTSGVHKIAGRGKETTNEIEWSLYMADTIMAWYVSGNGTNVTNSIIKNPVAVGTWYMVTVVFDAGTMSAYLNGSLIESKAAGFTTLAQYGTNEFRIGADMDGAYQTDIGVDAARWYDTALTQSDITALYNGGEGLQY